MKSAREIAKMKHPVVPCTNPLCPGCKPYFKGRITRHRTPPVCHICGRKWKVSKVVELEELEKHNNLVESAILGLKDVEIPEGYKLLKVHRDKVTYFSDCVFVLRTIVVQTNYGLDPRCMGATVELDLSEIKSAKYEPRKMAKLIWKSRIEAAIWDIEEHLIEDRRLT